MSTNARKPKSPPIPSRPLQDCVEDVKILYDAYTRGKFEKAEIASKFGVSAKAGPFQSRIFTLKTFKLLDKSGSQYSVSDTFMTLRSGDSSDPKFKRTALDAIRGSSTFKELLDEFKDKLPSVDDIATRLENQKHFNPARAQKAATVLEKSLRYAGVLDGANNILPIRDEPGAGTGTGEEESQPGDQTDPNAEKDVPPGMLGTEIPIGEARRVIVRYPPDLTPEEAKKIGNVLSAIVA